jgi:hypothetical protein
LRKQNHSILDIKSVFHAKGHDLSHGYIHKVLQEDGFAKLPKRSAIERNELTAKLIEAPTSRQINWEADLNKELYSERSIGILAFLPYNKFFSNGGSFKIIDDCIKIEFKKKRHLPLLMEYLQKLTDVTIPWLGGKKLEFSIASTS